MAYLINCPEDDCGNCSGKYNTCSSYVNWHGNDGFTDPLPVCGITPSEVCLYGGTKFLGRKVVGDLSSQSNGSSWQWSGPLITGAWTLEPCSFAGYIGHVDNLTTINKKSGCKQSVGTRTETPDVPSCGSCNCTEETVNGVNLCPYICDDGFGNHIPTSPLDIWTQLGCQCGVYNGFQDGCGNVYFGGGSATDLINVFPMDWRPTVTVDEITNTHIGFDARRDFSYTNPSYPPGTPPPQRTSDLDPSSYCAAVEFHARIRVTVDLSLPYTDQDLYATCVDLLSHYSLKTTKWFPAIPTCDGGQYAANYFSTRMPQLHYNDVGCCASGMAALGTTYADCGGADETIIHDWIRAGTPESFPVPLTWGALVKFVPNGNAGAITIQKWALRQGSYLPRGYQVGSPKTWIFLRQAWTIDACSGMVTYSCQGPPPVGGERFIIAITPNGEFAPEVDGRQHCFWFFPLYTFIPERTNGNIWQSHAKDADADKYPNDCYTFDATSDPPTYIEPESCACNCPTRVICDAPGEGVCPFEPENNWPAFGP